ncbi:MAG: adenosylcobinamide-GDP ribazoletransferase [Rhodobacteraceae bacterium]|nr:adenosylcobinamide-GDP ribazoletransferase [Paracoccaceae bacterium]
MRDLFASAVLAAQFLTRLPLPAHGYTPARWARVPQHFALVGLVVGGVLAALYWGLNMIWPQALAAVIMLACALAITGALHEDGLADSLDGLGGGRDRARALEIMRDSQIGSYGALGLGVALALQAVALATTPVAVGAGGLLVGHTLSRAMMAHALGQGRYLRDKGAGVGLDLPLGTAGWALTLASCGAAVLLAALVIGAGGVLSSLAVGLVTALAWRRWTLRRLGGDTGDTLGALQVVCLTGCLLGAAAWA